MNYTCINAVKVYIYKLPLKKMLMPPKAFLPGHFGELPPPLIYQGSRTISLQMRREDVVIALPSVGRCYYHQSPSYRSLSLVIVQEARVQVRSLMLMVTVSNVTFWSTFSDLEAYDAHLYKSGWEFAYILRVHLSFQLILATYCFFFQYSTTQLLLYKSETKKGSLKGGLKQIFFFVCSYFLFAFSLSRKIHNTIISH